MNKQERLIDWASAGFINSTDAVSNSLLSAFNDFEHLTLSLIENDPELPISLYLMPSFLFDQFACGERTAFLIPDSLNYEHEDNVIVIAINENGFPTGDWLESVIYFQDYAGTRSEGLCDGFDLVVFEL